MTPLDPSDATIDLVAALLKTVVGLRPELTLRARLRRCIRDEADALALSPDQYVRELTAREHLRQGLLDRITVQESGFFRHPDHFDVLATEILPRLTPPITIWSAGCANGQEAYSLAMLLDERSIAGTVIASDVSTSALRRTQAATYSVRESAGLSPVRQSRHLTRVDEGFQITRRIHDRVVSFHHNLLDPIPCRVVGSQVVFCRNVLIYFSVPHAQAFLGSLARALPQAWVFLGAAETMSMIGDGYTTLRLGKSYVYRPADAAGGTRAVALPQKVTSPAPARLLTKQRLAARRARVSDSEKPASILTDTDTVAGLSRAGQEALAAGDEQGAVVIFRQWAYLAPHDALAHLHLALALEALGDQPSAQRAFGAAERALQRGEPGGLGSALDGFAPAELHGLLKAKRQEPIR